MEFGNKQHAYITCFPVLQHTTIKWHELLFN